MQIIKEKYEIEETLNKRVRNIFGVIGVPRPPIILEFEENNQMIGL